MTKLGEIRDDDIKSVEHWQKIAERMGRKTAESSPGIHFKPVLFDSDRALPFRSNAFLQSDAFLFIPRRLDLVNLPHTRHPASKGKGPREKLCKIPTCVHQEGGRGNYNDITVLHLGPSSFSKHRTARTKFRRRPPFLEASQTSATSKASWHLTPRGWSKISEKGWNPSILRNPYSTLRESKNGSGSKEGGKGQKLRPVLVSMPLGEESTTRGGLVPGNRRVRRGVAG